MVKPETMPEYGTFKATEERAVSLLRARGATKAVDTRAHGVLMTPLKTAQTLQIEQFTIETSSLRPGVRRPQRRHADRHGAPPTENCQQGRWGST